MTVTDNHLVLGAGADAHLYLDWIVSFYAVDCRRNKWSRVWRYPVGGESLDWILLLGACKVFHSLLTSFWGRHTKSFRVYWLPCLGVASLRRTVIVIPYCRCILIFTTYNINQVLITIWQGAELIIARLRLGYGVRNFAVEADHKRLRILRMVHLNYYIFRKII